MDEVEQEPVEREIERILQEEASAANLADLLFAPGGLFTRLARSEHERRQVARTALFRRAQDRLAELQQREGEEFRRLVSQSQEGPLAYGGGMALGMRRTQEIR